MNLHKVRRCNFGILREYQKRAEKRMHGTHNVLATPKFFVTPTRP